MNALLSESFFDTNLFIECSKIIFVTFGLIKELGWIIWIV